MSREYFHTGLFYSGVFDRIREDLTSQICSPLTTDRRDYSHQVPWAMVLHLPSAVSLEKYALNLKLATHLYCNNEEFPELYLHCPYGLRHDTDRHTLLPLTTHQQFSDIK